MPILRTKLHRPLPTPDVIARPRLIKMLDRGLEVPVTLVSAPAGFGKSTLVSQWVGGLDTNWKCGWFSVEKSDNDLETFILYLVSAVRTAVPESCPDSNELLQINTPSPASDFARVLSNDLMNLKDDLVLVVDDFHRIRDHAINEFLVGLLAYPPPSMRLVIVTRRDPAFSLNRLRGQGYLNELRLDSLRFTRDEASTFLSTGVGEDVPAALVDLACGKIEGWPLALRLLVLSRHEGNLKDVAEKLPNIPAAVGIYLAEEILANLPDGRVEALLQTSVLDRFCPELCEAVVPGLDGAAFLKWLNESNLFVIPLGGEEQWCRYHHFFQDTLRNELGKRRTEEEICGTYRRAGEWLGAQHLVNEAVDHFLKAGDLDRVGSYLAGEILENEHSRNGRRARKWIERLPPKAIDAHPVLGIEHAANLLHDCRLEESFEIADRVEASLLDSSSLSEKQTRYVRGTLDWISTWKDVPGRDYAELAGLAERALDQVPPGLGMARARIYQTWSNYLWYSGEGESARAAVEEGLQEFRGTILPYLVVSAGGCLLDLYQGDMESLLLSGTQLAGACRDHPDYRIIGRYYAGWAAYQLNKLEAAEQWCEEGRNDALTGFRQFYFFSRQLEVLISIARGRLDEAERLLGPLHDVARRDNFHRHTYHFEATRALVALGRGRPSEAARRVVECRSGKFRLGHFDERASVPLQVLLVQDTPSSRERAGEILLDQCSKALTGMATLTKIELLILRAMWHHAGDRGNEALGDLAEALRLALPASAVRLFADIAMTLPGLLPLLPKLDLDEEGIEFVGRIVQAATPRTTEASSSDAVVEVPRPPAGSFIDALSKREHEILILISRRLSNNEISETLFISLATVKSHLSNIYEKLAVHSRKQAVAKALGLGLLKR